MRFWKRGGTLAISPMRGRKAPDAAVGGHSQQRTAALAPVPAAVVRPCDALSLQGALGCDAARPDRYRDRFCGECGAAVPRA